MRIMTRVALFATTALLVAGLGTSASAQTELKLNQVGAAVATPLISLTPGVVTYTTITNVGPTDRNLHFNAIGDDWETTDFDCPVTASETILIVFTQTSPSTGIISMECNQGTGLPVFVQRAVNFTAGTLFTALETFECKNATCTTNENDLFADWIVVNPEIGDAYSAEAVPFQGIDPLAPGVADRDYHFNNEEYAMFPATLATNFFATGQNPIGFTTATLILFNLDGRANIGSQSAVDIVFYDDEETPTSAHYEFDCFSIVELEQINPNFNAQLLGSETGHLYMTVIDADQSSNVHDNKWGNGNSIRVVGVHGWLVQSINGASFARTLAQGMMPQDLDGDDIPTFEGL